MSATPSSVEDPGAFVAKWRGAWPEWAVVEGFLPAADRARVDAWQALQFELQEAAWGGADARPGELKLGWWVEELDGWSRGMRRHPLGAVLQRDAAPWRELARALPTLAASRERAVDDSTSDAALRPVAAAVAAVENAVFGGTTDSSAVVAAWQYARLARHAGTAVPLSRGEDMRAWSSALLAAWPSASGATVSRRIALALARARLARGDASAPLPPWSALWSGWRAARR